MKKSLRKLLLGATLLVAPGLVSAQNYSPNIQRLKDSLTECIKTNNCDGFENLRQELGVKTGASEVDDERVYYYRGRDGKYLGKIRDSEGPKVKNGVNFYYANEILSSSNDFHFVKRLEYASGKIDVVIGNLSQIEKEGDQIQRNWSRYRKNHQDFVNGADWNPEMEAVYGAITELNNQKPAEAYKTLYLEGVTAHELVPHDSENLEGEKKAFNAELRTSKFGLMAIERGLKIKGNDSTSRHYRSVAEELNGDLIRAAGSKRKLYQMSSAQLRRLVGD